MKLQLKPLISTLLLLSASSIVYAEDQTAQATSSNDPAMNALIKKINTQINAQEKTISELRAEVSQLKAQEKATQAQATTAMATATTAKASTDAANTARHHLLQAGASPVITAPYLGVPSRWDAADLIVNQPTYNEDVLMMQRDAAMDKALAKRGYPNPTNPIVEVSGKVEAQAWAQHPMSGRSISDIDVTGGELDFTTHVSDWVNGLASLAYDNSSPDTVGSPTTNSERYSNSRIYMSQAFITIGNLTKSPFYGTIGQRTVPFGHYSSGMIDDPYTKTIFRIKPRALLVGYQPMIGKLGPYATAFVFKGDTKVGGGQNNINNYGADLGYLFCKNLWNGDIGFSGIANVADSLGMQNNGIEDTTQFRGFGFSPSTQPQISPENLERRVPGANTHMSISYGNFSWLGEANTATSRFAGNDLSFNNHGAKPAAVHTEVGYSFNVGAFPSSWWVGYDHTWQALGLAIPQTRYLTTFNISLFKNTIEELQFKREINYASSNTAGGQLAPVTLPGHFANTVTAQVGYYF